METMQVMDDEICYRATNYLTIHKLFATRADLHITVYTHAKVKAIELTVLDALVKADPYFHIASSINQPSDFWKLDDSVLKTIESSSKQELKESRDLIIRIHKRQLYQINGTNLKEDDVDVSNVKIDLTRGMENPLERIKFFKIYFDHLWLPYSFLRLLRNMSKNFFLNKMLAVILRRLCLMTIEGNSHPLTLMRWIFVGERNHG